MEKKGVVVNSSEVKPFICDESYYSKLLLDDIVGGEKTININEGTLAASGKTPGATHKKNEIYYVVKGEAILHLGKEIIDIKPGSVVLIPGGVFHSLENKSDKDEFVLLTLWEDQNDNEVYHLRMKAWGKSFKTVFED